MTAPDELWSLHSPTWGSDPTPHAHLVIRAYGLDEEVLETSVEAIDLRDVRSAQQRAKASGRETDKWSWTTEEEEGEEEEAEDGPPSAE